VGASTSWRATVPRSSPTRRSIARNPKLRRDQTIYSDLGFILLGETIEKVSSVRSTDTAREIFRPLGLRATDYIDISQVRSRRLEPVPDMFRRPKCVPRASGCWSARLTTRTHSRWRSRRSCGTVRAGARGRSYRQRADRMLCGRSDFVPRKIIREFWTRDATCPARLALGWDTPSAEHSSSGHRLSPGAVGHLGFTGTSIWIEPEKEIAISMLTIAFIRSVTIKRSATSAPRFTI